MALVRSRMPRQVAARAQMVARILQLENENELLKRQVGDLPGKRAQMVARMLQLENENELLKWQVGDLRTKWGEAGWRLRQVEDEKEALEEELRVEKRWRDEDGEEEEESIVPVHAWDAVLEWRDEEEEEEDEDEDEEEEEEEFKHFFKNFKNMKAMEVTIAMKATHGSSGY